MTNTRIEYLYRDQSNYKRLNGVVVPGEITPEQQRRILATLEDGEYFVPRNVGLPETKFASTTQDDHDFFELDSASFYPTDKDPEITTDPEALTRRFEACAGKWLSMPEIPVDFI